MMINLPPLYAQQTDDGKWEIAHSRFKADTLTDLIISVREKGVTSPITLTSDDDNSYDKVFINDDDETNRISIFETEKEILLSMAELSGFRVKEVYNDNGGAKLGWIMELIE